MPHSAPPARLAPVLRLAAMRPALLRRAAVPKSAMFCGPHATHLRYFPPAMPRCLAVRRRPTSSSPIDRAVMGGGTRESLISSSAMPHRALRPSRSGRAVCDDAATRFRHGWRCTARVQIRKPVLRFSAGGALCSGRQPSPHIFLASRPRFCVVYVAAHDATLNATCRLPHVSRRSCGWR